MHNKNFTRSAGILFPISSLPSKYSIGSLGKSAYKFVDFLAASGQKYWQVLPLNPTSYKDSPYQSPCSLAGNPYFIDLEILYKDKLLSAEELAEAVDENKKIDYGKLFKERYKILRLAFKRFIPNDDYQKFIENHEYWLNDYALFMSLKVKNNYQQWTMWDLDEQDVKKARLNCEKYREEMAFWKFLQYTFFTQWEHLHQYARQLGIQIIGDMPIYVAFDSVEVWSNPSNFLLDETHHPILVAGCPPDGFSPKGQLWGNPIYNWDKMKKEHFCWWIERMRGNLELYDVIRIDHFRGFQGYFAIPAQDEDATLGKWYQAPGEELFTLLKIIFPQSKIIAEDLGFITDDVRNLLAMTGFPGMKVLQFAFDNDNSEYLPRQFKNENCLVYTGTHDNECTKTWFEKLNSEAWQRFNQECPIDTEESLTYNLINFALESKAILAIISLQDYLELSSEEARINTPSTDEGNWVWRLNLPLDKKLQTKIRKMMIKNNR